MEQQEIEKIFKIFFQKYTYYDIEEFYDVAAIGFVKALNTYDSSRSIKFSTYAITCMRMEILLEKRRQHQKKRYCNVISLDTTVTNDDNLILIDMICDNSSSLEHIASDIDVKTALEKLKNILHPTEFTIFNYVLIGFKDNEISKMLSMPIKSVTSIRNGFKSDHRLVELFYYYEILK